MTVDPPNTTITTLTLGGQKLHPQELTALIGVEPTKVWEQRHEWIKSSHPDMNTIEWRYEQKQQHGNLGEAIDQVLAVVWDKREAIRDYLAQHALKMRVSCRPLGDASVLEYIVAASVLSKLAYFNAELSLGIYRDELTSAVE